MNSNDGLVLVYTGRIIMIERIQAELESNGIGSIVKDEFRQGMEAGFGAGNPSAIDLFVIESDVEKAQKIIDALSE